MKFAVVNFPGSNCEQDCFYVASHLLGQPTEYLWHDDTDLKGSDVVILPGGFSYGDYLRCGAIAKFSAIIPAIRTHADSGGLVIGICNGFQILTEAGLLPGALVRNAGLHYLCRPVSLRVGTANSPFTNLSRKDQILTMPVGHGEGCYLADERTLDMLQAEDRVAFYYNEPLNGSQRDIAGILNEGRNVLGMMPHPDRCAEPLMGGTDGLAVFQSILASVGAPA